MDSTCSIDETEDRSTSCPDYKVTPQGIYLTYERGIMVIVILDSNSK